MLSEVFVGKVEVFVGKTKDALDSDLVILEIMPIFAKYTISSIPREKKKKKKIQ